MGKYHDSGKAYQVKKAQSKKKKRKKEIKKSKLDPVTKSILLALED